MHNAKRDVTLMNYTLFYKPEPVNFGRASLLSGFCTIRASIVLKLFFLVLVSIISIVNFGTVPIVLKFWAI